MDELMLAIEKEDVTEVKYVLTMMKPEYRKKLIRKIPHQAFLGSSKFLKTVLGFIPDKTTIEICNKYVDGKHSLFQLSCIRGKISVAITILNTRIPEIILSVSEDGNNILHLASYYNLINLVGNVLNEVHIEEHAVRELMITRNKNYELPLHVAAFEGNAACVDLLLKKDKTEIESKTIGGNTPLLKAAEGGSEDTMEVLVNHGADVTAVNNDNKSALAIRGRKCSKIFLSFMLMKGANLDESLLHNFQPDMFIKLYDECMLYFFSRSEEGFTNHTAKIVCLFGDFNSLSGIKNYLSIAKFYNTIESLKYHPVMQISIEMKFNSMKNKSCYQNVTFLQDMSLMEKAELILKLESLEPAYLSAQPGEEQLEVVPDADFCLMSGRCLSFGSRALNVPYYLNPDTLQRVRDMLMARGLTMTRKSVALPRGGATPFIIN